MKQLIKSYALISILGLSTNLAADNTVTINMPKVPEVPKVEAEVPQLKVNRDTSYKTNDEIIQELTHEKVVIFSDHVAPKIIEKKDDLNKVIEVGDISNGRVAAYLHAPYMEPKDVEKILTDAGFEVIKSYKIDKKGLATSIVFTNKAISETASKKERGFAGSLRITVDKKNKLISISNPIYAMKAFLQTEYDQKLAEQTLSTLRDSFKDLKNSNENIKFIVLERFQFMEGMPRYNDMVLIKEEKNEVLYNKAKKSKKVLYEQKLANGSIILGLKLSKRTSKFIKKIGYQNAGLLPYPVLIEDGKAKILDPKYYIAVMYPMLKMSQFMTISTVPGAINKEIDKIFR